MTEIGDDAVRAFMAAEVPGILDEHLSLAIKSIDGDRVRAGLAAALPYLLAEDRTEKELVPTCGVCGRPVDVADLAPPTVSMVEVPDHSGLVVRPVLSKPIRMDPETGAVCWCREAP